MPNLQTSQTGAPPLPPDITNQQKGPALEQYAQKAVANGAGAAPAGENPTVQFVKSSLKQIADLMAKVAKVLAVERPELVPIIKQMAGAGRALENEFSKSQGQGSPAATGSDPSQDAPEGPSTLGLSE